VHDKGSPILMPHLCPCHTPHHKWDPNN